MRGRREAKLLFIHFLVAILLGYRTIVGFSVAFHVTRHRVNKTKSYFVGKCFRNDPNKKRLATTWNQIESMKVSREKRKSHISNFKSIVKTAGLLTLLSSWKKAWWAFVEICWECENGELTNLKNCNSSLERIPRIHAGKFQRFQFTIVEKNSVWNHLKCFQTESLLSNEKYASAVATLPHVAWFPRNNSQPPQHSSS